VARNEKINEKSKVPEQFLKSQTEKGDKRKERRNIEGEKNREREQIKRGRKREIK
jgi:hypothetical protein